MSAPPPPTVVLWTGQGTTTNIKLRGAPTIQCGDGTVKQHPLVPGSTTPGSSTTTPITTTPGSLLVFWIARGESASNPGPANPTDSYANTMTLKLGPNAYAGFPASTSSVYVAPTVNGGQGETATLTWGTFSGTAQDEATVVMLELIGTGLSLVASSFVEDTGATLDSLPVTTTGDTMLIAFVAGTGNSGQLHVFTDSTTGFTKLTPASAEGDPDPNGYIQISTFYKFVPAADAGASVTTHITVAGTGGEGAQMYLLAFQASAGTAYTQSVGESIPAPTDALARLFVGARAPAENVAAMTDAISRLAAYQRGPADSVAAPTDAPARAFGVNRAIADAVPAPTDAVTRQTAATRAVADATPAPTDAPTRTFAGARAIGENVPAPTDAAARAFGVNRAATESVSAPTDAVARLAAFHRGPTENVTAPTDVVSRLFTGARAIADSVPAVTDAVARLFAGARAIGESITAPADAVSSIKNGGSTAYSRNPSDSVPAPTDTVSRLFTGARALAEAIASPSDTVARLVAAARSVADATPAPVDSVARRFAGSRSIADAVSAPADAPTRTFAGARATGESVPAPTDTVSRLVTAVRALAETIAAPTDAVARRFAGSRNAAESTPTPTDSVTGSKNGGSTAYSRTVSDSIPAPTDAVARLFAGARALAESITKPTDAAARFFAGARALAESIASPSDAVSRALVLARSVAESVLAPADSVASVKKGSGAQYVRSVVETTPAPTDKWLHLQGGSLGNASSGSGAATTLTSSVGEATLGGNTGMAIQNDNTGRAQPVDGDGEAFQSDNQGAAMLDVSLASDVVRSLINRGTPVISARQWTTALSSNAAGNGWNYIMASFTGNSPDPVEWTVLKNFTTTPVQAQFFTTTHGNPNPLFQISQLSVLRAPNGRIFFPCLDNRISYYDPTTETITEITGPGGIPPVVETPPVNPNASTILYSAVFDVGGILYMATQESANRPSCLVSLDPNSLAVNVVGYFGDNATAFTTYGYRLAPDTGTATKGVYAVFGESSWQLWWITLGGVATKLLEVTSSGNIQFQNIVGKGWIAIVDTDLGQPDNVRTSYWCIDGAISTYTIGSNAPGTGNRNVTPASNPLVAPPDVDTSGGAGAVGWRANGSSGAFTYLNYTVTHSSPFTLEMLVPTSDGVLISSEQYQGFVRYNANTHTGQWFGAQSGNTMAQPLALYVPSIGAIFITGYPDGTLFNYNPNAPWQTYPTQVNPALVGFYGPSGNQLAGIKYVGNPNPPTTHGNAGNIVWDPAAGTSGRLYVAGQRDRTGTGAGIGYWDQSSNTIVGTFASPLDAVQPQGLALAGPGRIAMSTNTVLGGVPAPLHIFDSALTLLATQYPIAGVANLGPIYPTSTANVICGAYISGGVLRLYRWNTLTGTMVQQVTTSFAGVIDCATIAPDDSIWLAIVNSVVRVDPNTLDAQLQLDITSIAPVTCMAFHNSELYLTADSVLWSY